MTGDGRKLDRFGELLSGNEDGEYRRPGLQQPSSNRHGRGLVA